MKTTFRNTKNLICEFSFIKLLYKINTFSSVLQLVIDVLRSA